MALNVAGEDGALWVWDLARATLTRLTFEKGQDYPPLWTRDGRRLVFSSDRAGILNLFVQAADGTGSATRLTEGANPQIPTGTTVDGTGVVFQEQTPRGQRDLRLLTLSPTPHVGPLVETPFDKRGGVVSPDGHWLAYQSNSSGAVEVYVRPFPNTDAGQWQVSNGGGQEPLWARSGRELFYRTPDGQLVTVPVEVSGTTWSAGTATKLVEGRYYNGGGGGNSSQEYDVSPDGQRFLMLKGTGGTDQTAAPPQIIVVQHFDEELKRLVPRK